MNAPRLRLWVEPERLRAGRLAVEGDDFHYLVRVRRLRAGDALCLFDGAGREADAAVAEVAEGSAALEVAAPRDVASPRRPELIVLLSLIKGDRTEWAIQKLVELGADRVIPVQAERCVVRLAGKRADERLRRYGSVARAAAQQCRRPTLPEVAPVASLSEAVAAVPADALKLMLYERARGETLASALPAAPPPRVALLVGPEGGFAPAEVDAARAAGFRPVAFGPRVLRAETAAIAAAAVLGYALGDL